MKFAKSVLAFLVCLACLGSGPAFAVQTEYILMDGTRARVEGKKLIVIGKNARARIAPVGLYVTRDGRYTIVVRGTKVIVRDHTKELR